MKSPEEISYFPETKKKERGGKKKGERREFCHIKKEYHSIKMGLRKSHAHYTTHTKNVFERGLFNQNSMTLVRVSGRKSLHF